MQYLTISLCIGLLRITLKEKKSLILLVMDWWKENNLDRLRCFACSWMVLYISLWLRWL